MKRVRIFAAFCLAIVAVACADEGVTREEESILSAVNLLIESVNTGDLNLRNKASRNDGQIYIVSENGDGAFTTSTMLQSDFNRLEDNGKKLFERLWDTKVIFDERVAVVWASYDFHVDGEFSHCGVDVFNLIKENDLWKVANMTWTVQKTECEPSPFGVLGAVNATDR